MAASTVRDTADSARAGRFNLRFDRRVATVRACFGNDGPGFSLQHRCDRPNGWSGGWGPLNGNFDLDESRGANSCDTIWFQERFGAFPITLDRLQISFCPRSDTCTVIGDGETRVIPFGPEQELNLCSPDFPL